MTLVIAIRYIVLLAVVSLVTCKPMKIKKSQRLYKHLLGGYDAHFRPTEGGNATIVHFDVMMNDINSLEEGTLESIIKASVWVSMEWKDERLAWDQSQFPPSSFMMNPQKIWTPDIRLFNSLDPKIRQDDKVKAIIKHDGTVQHIIPMWLLVHCHRPRMPKASWECLFNFGSWVYNGYQLDLYIRPEGLDLSGYSSKVWALTANTGVRRVIKRRCCKESWAEATYMIRLIRR